MPRGNGECTGTKRNARAFGSGDVAETDAYQRDLPGAEVHILDAGHFALYEKPDEIAKLVGDFLGRTLSRPAAPSNDRDAAIRGCLSALGRWIR